MGKWYLVDGHRLNTTYLSASGVTKYKKITMDRRESIKTLLIGTVAGGALAGACQPEVEGQEVAQDVKTETTEEGGGYGRTPKELAYDKELYAETFFSAHEMATIGILCDIILPADEISPAASEAKVADFVEFIVKDMPDHQLPMRGGLMWLDLESKRRFGKVFKEVSAKERLSIIDDIAWPDRAEPNMSQGVKFFERMRNLTMTGFYTSELGVKTLGYQGNMPNVWDGVPEEELKRLGMTYDSDWISKCIDQNTREAIATWDEAGNLLT